VPLDSSASPFHFEFQGDVAVITLQPSLSHAPWSEVERSGDQILTELAGRREPRCVIDLSPLEYMGSALVALITRIWKNVRSADGICVIACPNDVPREVISIAGLDKVWTVASSRPEALTEVNGYVRRAFVSRRWTFVLIVGFLGLAAAAAGAALAATGAETPRLASGLLFGGAACGFVAGLACLMIDRSRRRYLGLGLLLLSVAAALTGLWFGRPVPASLPADDGTDGGAVSTRFQHTPQRTPWIAHGAGAARSDAHTVEAAGWQPALPEA
jgi:anti-anti-sigma factor